MSVYVDTSAILRRLFHASTELPNWGSWEQACTRELWRVEAMRTTHRLRMENRIKDQDVARLCDDMDTIDGCFHVIRLSPEILRRASEAMPAIIGTLDALHLATALHARTTMAIDRFITHDKQQALAAKAVGFTVEGVNRQSLFG